MRGGFDAFRCLFKDLTICHRTLSSRGLSKGGGVGTDKSLSALTPTCPSRTRCRKSRRRCRSFSKVVMGSNIGKSRQQSATKHREKTTKKRVWRGRCFPRETSPLPRETSSLPRETSPLHRETSSLPRETSPPLVKRPRSLVKRPRSTVKRPPRNVSIYLIYNPISIIT